MRTAGAARFRLALVAHLCPSSSTNTQNNRAAVATYATGRVPGSNTFAQLRGAVSQNAFRGATIAFFKSSRPGEHAADDCYGDMSITPRASSCDEARDCFGSATPTSALAQRHEGSRPLPQPR